MQFIRNEFSIYNQVSSFFGKLSKDRMVVCAGGNANGGQTCEMLPPHMKLWDEFPQTLAYRSWNPGMAATSWGLVLAGSYYR